jgi:UDP-N-acetylmuramate dehydrogenase
MNISDNISLAEFSTMRLGGNAAHLVEIRTRQDVAEGLAWARQNLVPAIMIGGGSNIVWKDEGFPGLVMVNRIMGYEVQEIDESSIYITLGSGEPWDAVVERTVLAGYTGIEALSLIPGSAGATPVQNVSAYGQEISQTLTTVEAYDTQTSQFVTIPASDCGFAYRTSRFKTTDRGRFFITGLTLSLAKGNPMPPFYGSVQAYFDEHNITDYTPNNLREAVIAIRSAKLPDPAVVHNTGSFFTNPIIPKNKFLTMNIDDATTPHWPVGNDAVKLSAAWLIDQAGFKDYHDPETGMATWPRQSLVLINEHAQSTAALLTFKQKIVDAVQAKFGITLEQEPELLP